MASSAQQLGAERAQPSRARTAALYEDVDRMVAAVLLKRNARAAELAERAASKAEALYAPDSLVFANLRVELVWQVLSLMAHASNAEKDDLLRRAAAALLPVTALVQRRLIAGALLPGSVRKDELECDVHAQACLWKHQRQPVPAEAHLRRAAVSIGYEVLIKAALRCLQVVDIHASAALAPADVEAMEAFFLAALDVIPLTAAIRFDIGADIALAAHIERFMNAQHFKPAFCDAVHRKWRSDAVQNVLRARAGGIHNAIAQQTQGDAEYAARQRADVTTIGLRECALPSCEKVERTVREFKQCSGCRSVWYCSPEHQMQDWGVHRNACGELDVARKAAGREAGRA